MILKHGIYTWRSNTWWRVIVWKWCSVLFGTIRYNKRMSHCRKSLLAHTFGFLSLLHSCSYLSHHPLYCLSHLLLFLDIATWYLRTFFLLNNLMYWTSSWHVLYKATLSPRSYCLWLCIVEQPPPPNVPKTWRLI